MPIGDLVKSRDCLIAQTVDKMPKSFSQERWRWLAAIGAVSSCASMNGTLVFVKKTSLNVWFMGIGATGTGKSESYRPVEWMLRQIPDMELIAGNITKAALLDRLEQNYDTAKRAMGFGTKTLRAYGVVFNDEWTDVMPGPDQELLSAFIKSWGDQSELTEFRRHSKRKDDFVIPFPTITMLAAIQPEKFPIIFPASSGAEGFARRMMFSYETPKPKTKINPLTAQLAGTQTNQNPDVLAKFVPNYTAIWQSTLWVEPDQTAADVWGKFIEADGEPKVKHIRAKEWNTTREQYMAKIGGLFAVSRHFAANKRPVFSEKIYMNGDDLAAAIDMVQWCEQTFVDFYATQVDTSYELIWAELHQLLTVKSRSESEIKRWLSERFPSWQVKSLWETAKETRRVRLAPTASSGVSIGNTKLYTSGGGLI